MWASIAGHTSHTDTTATVITTHAIRASGHVRPDTPITTTTGGMTSVPALPDVRHAPSSTIGLASVIVLTAPVSVRRMRTGRQDPATMTVRDGDPHKSNVRQGPVTTTVRTSGPHGTNDRQDPTTTTVRISDLLGMNDRQDPSASNARPDLTVTTDPPSVPRASSVRRDPIRTNDLHGWNVHNAPT